MILCKYSRQGLKTHRFIDNGIIDDMGAQQIFAIILREASEQQERTVLSAIARIISDLGAQEMFLRILTVAMHKAGEQQEDKTIQDGPLKCCAREQMFHAPRHPTPEMRAPSLARSCFLIAFRNHCLARASIAQLVRA